MRTRIKSFEHNGKKYEAHIKQEIGDSNYNLRVRIFHEKKCIIGYNARNNSKTEHIIDAAKLTLSDPKNFVLDYDIQERLERIRTELRADRISYGELDELQSLAKYIDPSDVELLEAAGVPEKLNR